MIPSGPPNQIGGNQSLSSSQFRSNSGYMGSQGSPMNPQMNFPSALSPHMQYNGMNMLSNGPNASSLLNQSFGNGGPGVNHQASMNPGAESDPLSNRMAFPSPSFISADVGNNGTSNQVQNQSFQSSPGNQMLPDQQQHQQLRPHDSQNFQHNQQQSLQQFSNSHNGHRPDMQQSYQMNRGIVGPVKLEPKVGSDFHGQPLRNDIVKLEPQMQSMRGPAPVKAEPQHSDQSLFLQQQQQLLQMSRQPPRNSSVAQMNIMNQHRLLQLQEQQQQLLGVMPQQQMSQLHQQFPAQSLPLRSPGRPPYEPGTCARRLTHYMYQQQHRPQDNNIEFWRKFVTEYFAPHAKKKWCVSMYGSGRQTSGVFPQDVWHCEICNRKPGRGFEATAEVLPRLFKIKYESGTLEELLYVDMPREYPNASGQIVLDYAKAIQESVFDQLRVVRDGQLRIVFSADLKICSWEFCARRHEELIPRRVLLPQVSQLGAAAQKYQAASQNANPNLSAPELQNNCNTFVTSARNLAKALEVPLVNDLGYTKRYVRCLQISEVVNSMKDLIDYSRETGTGPMESLIKFPRRTIPSPQGNGPPRQGEDCRPSQQQLQPNAATLSNNDNDQGSQKAASNGVLLHQNSMNSRQQNNLSNAHSPYGGSSHQAICPSNTIAQVHSTMPPSHTTGATGQPGSSPFNSPTASSSNNNPPPSSYNLTASAAMSSENSPANMPMQQPTLPTEADGNDQSSVQKILQDIMMSSQHSNGGNSGSGLYGSATLGNDARNISGMLQGPNSAMYNGGSSMPGNGITNNNAGFGTSMIGGGLNQSSSMVTGLGNTMNSSVSMNGRMGMASLARDQILNQPQDMGGQLLSGLGSINGFNNSQFDWKNSS
ncbi:unnamed protein product [Rhodiola kirilowii]